MRLRPPADAVRARVKPPKPRAGGSGRSESQAELRSLYHTAPVGLCFLDAELRYVAINDRLAAINGLPAARHVGRTLREIVPQLADELEPVFRRVLDTGEPLLDWELRGTTPADPGVEHTWLASYHPVRNASGRVRGVSVVVQDVTERRHTAEALREANESLRQREEFLHTIGDRLPKAMFFRVVHHPDGSFRFTYASEGLRELVGLTPDELFARSTALTDRILEEDRAHFFEAMARSLRALSPLDEVCRMYGPDGGIRWCHFRSSVHPLPDGTIACEGIQLDITESKRAQLDAQASRLELARGSRVTMLGEIAASLAHELSQPLTAILNNAQAAQRLIATDGLRSEEMAEILADIVEADERAGEVIRRLRGWLNRDRPVHQAVPVNQVIHEVEQLVRSELILRQVPLVTDLGSDLPDVPGDRVQLQQVVLNLLLNAVEAMHDRPPGERQLLVRTSAAGDGIEVAVVDRGSGIRPEHLERLFDPFFSTKATGLGIGLRICSSIVQSHGGRIWATNNPDVGATLHFTLPSVGAGPA